MIELLDPEVIDNFAYDKGMLREIKKFSLLSDQRIGWNYCMDYTWVAIQCSNYLKPGMRIVDIGCGPGAIHGYLESVHQVDIIGIDINRWEKDYVDIQGDFTRKFFRKRHGFNTNSIDCIISISAFEHNKPSLHQKLVKICLETLKINGRLITTFAASKSTHYFKQSHQWNLSDTDIENIYGESTINFSKYDDIQSRWHRHRDISRAYEKRYGSWHPDAPSFLSIGANMIKKP